MVEELMILESQNTGIKQLKGYCKVTYERMNQLLDCERKLQAAQKPKVRKNMAELTQVKIIVAALKGMDREEIAKMVGRSQRTITAALSGMTKERLQYLRDTYPDEFCSVTRPCLETFERVGYSFVKYKNYYKNYVPLSGISDFDEIGDFL